jgi:hypothetical protein
MILNMFWSISETGAMIGKQLLMSGGKNGYYDFCLNNDGGKPKPNT